VVKKYKNRVGLLLGAALFSLILSLCGCMVWDISLSEGVLDPSLEAAISKAGLKKGMFISDFDSEAFRASFLNDNPEYSYVSAGIHGCRAYVWLNERTEKPELEGIEGAANLIAGFDGRIVRCEAISGEVKVKHGDAVSKGQLLVSGIVELKNGAYRIEEAKGRVFAATEREFSTAVNLEAEEKIYTGREKNGIFINILGKNINFFNFSGNLYEFYDTIEEREEIYLFGSFKLPFYRVKRSYLEYGLEKVIMDEKRAEDLCYDRYHEFLDGIPYESILEEKVDMKNDGTKLTMTVRLSLVEDIALSKPFGFKELGE